MLAVFFVCLFLIFESSRRGIPTDEKEVHEACVNLAKYYNSCKCISGYIYIDKIMIYSKQYEENYAEKNSN